MAFRSATPWVTMRKSRNVPAKELTAEGYRSSSEVMESQRYWRAPLFVVQEKVKASPRNGLAEGAVRELKTTIRTLRQAAEAGLRRQIPEGHDVLAWMVQRGGATVNRCRAGLDRKTPHELRRPVAPFGQKVRKMSAQKHVSGISSERRWQDGLFLGLVGAGVGWANCPIDTPDGVNAEQAHCCLKRKRGT